MAEAKRPLSIRVPGEVYEAIAALAQQTGQSITEVSVSLLASGVGQSVPTPGDRLGALEKEVASLRGKLLSLASS